MWFGLKKNLGLGLEFFTTELLREMFYSGIYQEHFHDVIRKDWCGRFVCSVLKQSLVEQSIFKIYT